MTSGRSNWRREGYVHVPPYDDPRVIAGQGTVGLELLEQVPDVEIVLVPVSGGGLISGVATADQGAPARTSRVIGVEPELAADAAESLRHGRRITWEPERTYRTVADGLRTTALGVHPWEHVRRYVDEIVTVTDAQILAAMRHLAIEGRLVVEPAGAVAVAAWMHEVVPVGGRTAAVVSGGSVDPPCWRLRARGGVMSVDERPASRHIRTATRSSRAVWCSCPVRCRCGRTGSSSVVGPRRSRRRWRRYDAGWRRSDARLEDVVKATYYLTDITLRDEANAQFCEVWPAPRPARTVVEVSGLPYGSVVEIDVVARAR